MKRNDFDLFTPPEILLHYLDRILSIARLTARRYRDAITASDADGRLDV